MEVGSTSPSHSKGVLSLCSAHQWPLEVEKEHTVTGWSRCRTCRALKSTHRGHMSQEP